tara:strand:+ start:21523 stop:21789 length:267 start_codon:yes stop_codon:yes gene_type:complete
MSESQITGEPIKHHRDGWAKFCFGGDKAHWWVEDTKTLPPKITDQGQTRYYKSLCGQHNAANGAFPAFHPGSFDRCKNCQRKADKGAA